MNKTLIMGEMRDKQRAREENRFEGYLKGSDAGAGVVPPAGGAAGAAPNGSLAGTAGAAPSMAGAAGAAPKGSEAGAAGAAPPIAGAAPNGSLAAGGAVGIDGADGAAVSSVVGFLTGPPLSTAG